MDEKEHTPGPWKVTGEHRRYDRGIEGPDGEDIGFVNGSDGADEPTFYPLDANARLIAAAPVLLQLAQRWLALDASSWHQERYVAEKAGLLSDTRVTVAEIIVGG